jgi:2-iminobutanoate/2-iminopropanoate deaminase
MRRPVDTRLPRTAAPIEWATIGDDTLYTEQIPIRPGGTIEDGDIAAQTKTVFSPPYPNRSTIGADLMVKGAKIEIVAHATLRKD